MTEKLNFNNFLGTACPVALDFTEMHRLTTEERWRGLIALEEAPNVFYCELSKNQSQLPLPLSLSSPLPPLFSTKFILRTAP